MPKHVFSYTEVKGDLTPAFPFGRTAYRPLIEVEIKNGNQSVCCKGIVDSGADHCIFPADFLSNLGLNKSDLPFEKGHGAGGACDVYFARVTMRVDRIGDVLIYAGFDEKLNGWEVGLLGQTGLFDFYQISFDWQDKKFCIES